MNPVWNNISADQQLQFRAALGVSDMPAPESLNESQWQILSGIVGQETVSQIRESVPKQDISAPKLSAPRRAISDWSDIMMLVAEIKAKLGEVQSGAAMEDINATKERMATENKANAEKIKESIEKLHKANKSGLLGKIFGWIGAIIGLIGAAILTAATGGAAAPALAVACLGVAVMVLQETGAMEKIMEAMVDNPALAMLILGPVAGGILFALIESGAIDEDQAKMALQIIMAATMLIVNIAGGIMSGGTSSIGAIAQIATTIAKIAGAGAQVAQGASTIAQASYSKQASDAQADTQEINAWLAKLQQMLSEEADRLQQILDQINSAASEGSDALADISRSHRSIIANMGM